MSTTNRASVPLDPGHFNQVDVPEQVSAMIRRCPLSPT